MEYIFYIRLSIFYEIFDKKMKEKYIYTFYMFVYMFR